MYTICTLPISPVQDPPFERMITPIVAHALSRLLGLDAHLLINTTGFQAQRHWTKAEEAKKSFTDQLKQLGISTAVVSDSTQEYADYFYRTFSNSSLLSKKELTMSSCDCGRCYLPTESIQNAKYSMHTLVDGHQSNSFCKLCGSTLTVNTESVLMLDLSNASVPYVLHKNFLGEVTALADVIVARDMIVSRGKTEASMPAQMISDKGDIDTDFWWSLLPVFAAEDENEIVIVVSYNSIVHAVRTALILSVFFPARKVTLVVHPTVHVVGGKVPLRRMKLREYVAYAQSPFSARTFPLLGMTWGLENMNLLASELYYVQQSRYATYTYSSEKKCNAVKKACSLLSRNNILAMLKARRSGVVLKNDSMSLLDSVL